MHWTFVILVKEGTLGRNEENDGDPDKDLDVYMEQLEKEKERRINEEEEGNKNIPRKLRVTIQDYKARNPLNS